LTLCCQIDPKIFPALKCAFEENPPIFGIISPDY